MERRSGAFLATLFAICVMAFVVLAVLMLYGVGYLAPEAAVRAGVAQDLLDGSSRGREAAICSVWWTPLPTLAQLVFAGLPGAVSSGLAACLLSALGGAVLCLFIARAFLDSGFPRWAAGLAAALCGASPWILLAGASGGSQIWVLALVTAALFYFRRWTRTRRLDVLVCASVCLGLLPVIEHQTVLYVGVIFGAALLYMVFTRGFGLSKIEGTVVLGASPVFYMVGLWFLFNWLIMGNFLHFLEGVYIHPVGTAGAVPPAAELPGWLGIWLGREPMGGAIGEMMLIAPLLPVAAVVGVVAMVVRRKLLPLVVFGLAMAMPLFHAYMAYRGQSFGRHEDLLIAVPLSFFLLAHSAGVLLSRAREEVMAWPARSVRWVAAPAAALLGLALVGAYALVPTQREAMPLTLSASAPFVAVRGDEAGEIEAIKQVVEAKRQDIRVAVIGFEGYRFMRAVAGDERFLHYVNWDFGLINHNTKGKRLYLLVPKPEGAAKFDDVNVKFPILYEEANVRLDGREVRALLQAVDRPFINWRLIYATRYYPQDERTPSPQARTRESAPAEALDGSSQGRRLLSGEPDPLRSSP
jgi:hypothetical protein